MKLIKTKVLAFIISLAVLTMSGAVLAEEVPITVFVDGEQIIFDVDPIVENERTLVPMRFIFEALNAEVTWNGDLKTAAAVKDGNEIVLTIDSAIMLKNQEEITLDAPARLIDDRTLVPVRAVSEGLEAKVEWDREERKVIITTNDSLTDQSLVKTDSQLSYTELSEEDMKTLTSGNLIRYSFEQYYLPVATIVYADETSEIMRSDEERFTDFVNISWYTNAMNIILNVQAQSETEYDTPVFDENTDMSIIKDLYSDLLGKVGMLPEDMFGVAYKELKDGKKLALVTFSDTDELVACKYIGIVSDKDGAVRYFTAETDILDPEHLYFCEVTEESRGTIGLMDFEEESFVDFIEAVYEQDLKPGASMKK